MTKHSAVRAVGSALLVLTLSVLLMGGAQAQGAAVTSGYGPTPAGFIENLGQWDPEAMFKLSNGGLDVWLTREGVVYHAADLGLEEPLAVQPEGAEAIEPDPDATVPNYAVRAEFVARPVRVRRAPEKVGGGPAASGPGQLRHADETVT